MARGYTTLAAVAAAFAAEGVTLTSAQELLIGMDLEAVEAAIDAYTGRSWLTGAITAEVVYPQNGVLWLSQRPVASIEEIRTIGGLPATTTVLTADTDYRLLDAAQGRVEVLAGRGWGREAWTSGYILPGVIGQGVVYEVDYTPAATVPPLIAWAARETSKAWVNAAVTGIDDDVQRLSVFGQIDVTYKRDTATATAPRALPADVQARLSTLKAAVL